MKNKLNIKNIGVDTILQEASALEALAKLLDEDFEQVVQLLLQSTGRFVISGIGKSAIIAQKIVATLNSTGTPSIFMHAADAIHGDLGMIQPEDVVMVISKSGNTPEIKVLVSLLRQGNNKLVGMVGNLQSFLAENSDFVLDVTVDKEACPFNLAPTTSTTAQLAMGDALAVCLIRGREFSDRDFAKYHPGGALGKRLFVRIEDLYEKNSRPFIGPNASVKEIILSITKYRLGAVAVLDDAQIVGIVTDGDIRRMLESETDTSQIQAKDIMGRHPKTMEKDELAIRALEIMKQNNISQLLVTVDGQYEGIVHIHDLLREGIII